MKRVSLSADVNKRIARELLFQLVKIRTTDRPSDYVNGWDYGRFFGYCSALRDHGLITSDQFQLLDGLFISALRHRNQPFPCEANAGPVMPIQVKLDRRLEEPSITVEARVSAPVQVSEAPAFRRLFLLCVLVQERGGRLVHQPVQCLPRLRAPWAPVSGQWPLVLPAPLRLRPVSGQAPTISQLGCFVRQRQANAVCSYS